MVSMSVIEHVRTCRPDACNRAMSPPELGVNTSTRRRPAAHEGLRTEWSAMHPRTVHTNRPRLTLSSKTLNEGRSGAQ